MQFIIDPQVEDWPMLRSNVAPETQVGDRRGDHIEDCEDGVQTRDELDMRRESEEEFACCRESEAPQINILDGLDTTTYCDEDGYDELGNDRNGWTATAKINDTPLIEDHSKSVESDNDNAINKDNVKAMVMREIFEEVSKHRRMQLILPHPRIWTFCMMCMTLNGGTV